MRASFHCLPPPALVLSSFALPSLSELVAGRDRAYRLAASLLALVLRRSAADAQRHLCAASRLFAVQGASSLGAFCLRPQEAAA